MEKTFLFSAVSGFLFCFVIKKQGLAVILSTAAILIHKAVLMFSTPDTGGGASIWPVALFFVAVYAGAGSALGMAIANAVRKDKPSWQRTWPQRFFRQHAWPQKHPQQAALLALQPPPPKR